MISSSSSCYPNNGSTSNHWPSRKYHINRVLSQCVFPFLCCGHLHNAQRLLITTLQTDVLRAHRGFALLDKGLSRGLCLLGVGEMACP
ncbi:hypothetical protein CEXT_622371 [Caerostris extrusa]|uniref:Uncharacterized protein n=1 Tax=Caerostris extrusa TaxID=172846 RepID=A0AAV4SGH2_CAEEX|nr:hypothetical protein CEXT_622371 [Caerostris extrusa]